MRALSRFPLIPFLLASLFSGCAALLSQILWIRMLSLVFGSTIESVAAVTAVFMAGLALGSAIAPGWVRGLRAADASARYSRVEFGIGAWCLTLAFVLPALEPLRAAAGSPVVWLLAIVLLLVPAGLMGTTLVVQTQATAASTERAAAAQISGLLFAANTLGAVIGAYGSVLVLIPSLGVRKTIVVAATLNLFAALIGRLCMPRLARMEALDAVPVQAKVEAKPERGPKTTREPPIHFIVVMGALFVAGFAGLVNEVAWTRAFILIAGPTVHAFAFVVGAIVLGLSVGAFVISAILPALSNPRMVFALVQAALAVGCGFVIRSLASMPLSYGEDIRHMVDRTGGLLGLQAERSLWLLLPVAALSGALFPLGLRLLREGFSTAHAMGFASALNTLGAILGAGLAGFVLLPGLGLDHTLRLAATTSALSAMAVALRCRGAARGSGLLAGASALVFIALSPSFDKELFAGGAYKYSAYDQDLSVEDVLRRGELVSYAEGRAANVSVKRVGASFSLAVDGKVDATSGGDMLTQRLLAHVPFLVSEKPETALVIGFGSGVTASAALTHQPRSVTAVEISPEVVDAARAFFGHANRRVLEDPRLGLIIGDARQHIFGARNLYDVIISEPSNPWMAGVSALFTVEFFKGVKERLSPGGVFCQWGHLYNMAEDDLATLLATFGEVFPDSRVFVISEADILIVGSESPPTLSERRLAGIAEAARLDLRASNLEVSNLSAIPSVALRELSPWLSRARKHTDDSPVLDFSAPLSIHAQTGPGNRHRLLKAQPPTDPGLIRSRLALLGASGSTEWTYELAGHAIALGLADRAITQDYVKSAVRLHRTEQAAASLDGWIAREPTASLFMARALLRWNTNQPGPALESLAEATRLEPTEVSGYLLGAEIQSQAGNLQAMRTLVARALAVEEKNAEAIGLAAQAEYKDARFEPALRLAEGALRLDPTEKRALEVEALSLARLDRSAESRNSFLRLLSVSPDVAAARTNFGVFELIQGNPSAAARLFKDATDLDPADIAGYEGLKEAASALGRDDLVKLAERGLARLSRGPSR